MKKILLVLGAITGVVIIGLGITVYLAARHTASVAEDATPYLEEAMVAITSNWHPAELYARFVPEVRQATNPDDVEAFFDVVRRALGTRVTNVETEMLGWSSQASVGAGSITVADFLAHARFEKGDASFSVTLHKLDGNWMIHRFVVNSSLLLRDMAGSKT